MKHSIRITEAEWQVMKAIWKQAPCSAQTVIDTIAKPNQWSVATIKTLLGRLVRKGALSYEKQGKAFVYSAAISESECRGTEAESFLERIFDGSFSPLLAHFVQAKKLDESELAELESIIRSSKKKS